MPVDPRSNATRLLSRERCGIRSSGRSGATDRVAVVLFSLITRVAFAQSGTPETTGTPPPLQREALSAWSAPEPWRTDRFFIETNLYTEHFNTSSHDGHQHLVAVEWNISERWLAGAASFDNSFGQPSQFIYGGLRLRPIDSAPPF